MASLYAGTVLTTSGGAAISSIPPAITDSSNDILLGPAVSLLVLPALAITGLLWLLYHCPTRGGTMLAVGANHRAAELSGLRMSSWASSRCPAPWPPSRR